MTPAEEIAWYNQRERHQQQGRDESAATIATLTRERDEARRECEELREQLQHALLCLDRNCKRCRSLCLDQIHAVTELTNAAN